MSVWKEKTGTWMYQFKFQGKRPGERGFKTRKEALQAQEDRKKEVRREVREGINLLDGMKLYQEEMAKRIVRRTYEYKKFVLEGFLNHIGNVSLKSVTANQIISYLRTRPTNINYNRHRKEILSFLNYARKRKMIDENPCESINKLPETHAVRRTPTEEQVKKVMGIARPNELILLMILIHTLARIGEALKVMWKHVDFEGDNITLFTRKVKDGSLTPRVLPMDDVFKEFLKKVYEKRTQDVWIMKNNKTENKFDRRPKLMRSLCERAGVEPFGFHGLRHFGAVWLARHGVSMIYIQKMLGHRSLRTTVGDTESGPKSNILGWASAGIRTDPCFDFPA